MNACIYKLLIIINLVCNTYFGPQPIDPVLNELRPSINNIRHSSYTNREYRYCNVKYCLAISERIFANRNKEEHTFNSFVFNLRLPAGSAVTFVMTLSRSGALLSLQVTCRSFLPLSTSFIIQAQSGRFLGLDLSMSMVFCCLSERGGKSFNTVLPGGGGGGLGGGGGGMFALEALFDSVGAPFLIII